MFLDDTPGDPFTGRTLRLLLFTLGGLLLMFVVGSLIVGGLVLYYELPLGSDSAVYEGIGQRQQLRLVLLLNNLLLFGLAGIFGLYATYRNWWPVAAGLVAPTRPRLILPAMGTFLMGLPAILLSAYLNLQLELPEWMDQSEAAGNAMLAGVMTFGAVPELLMALLAVAVVPAFGEELLFRGILQRRLLGTIVSGNAAIWITAVVFSAIHVEFAGFLPRMLLGALLGYSYRWTGSLWIPILLHFLFNGLQVLATYASGEFTPDTEMAELDLPTLIFCGLGGLATVYLVWRTERRLATEAPDTLA